MPQLVSHPDVFVHVRIIIGMVLGLSLSRLIIGLTRFIQRPDGTERLHLIHFGWVVFLLLSIVHFWWFEFALTALRVWTFEIYVFLIFYAGLFVMLAAMLFPDKLDGYKGYQDYFQQRGQWFYGLLALMFVADLVDTRMKGIEHFRSFGIEYPIRQTLLALGATGAIFFRSRHYQSAFLAFALIYEVVWILRLFNVLE
jgi:hypothetical protein